MNTLSFELLQILLIYKFEKQYKKDKLSPETIKANRERDIIPNIGWHPSRLDKICQQCNT